MTECNVHRFSSFDFVPRPINKIAYDSNRKLFAVARFDGEGSYVEIWDVREGYWVLEQILPSHPPIESLLIKDSYVLMASLDSHVTLFHLDHPQKQSKVNSAYGPVWCLALNKQNNFIAAGTEEGTVVLLEIQNEILNFHKAVAKQPGKIFSIGWYEAKNLIVTGGTDVRVFNSENGRCIQRISFPKNTLVWTLVVASDFTIITGDSTGKTCFWFGTPGQLSHNKIFRSHEADIHNLTLSPSNSSLAAAGVDGIVIFRSTPSSSHPSFSSPLNSHAVFSNWVMVCKRTYHSNDVRSVCYLDDHILASGGLDSNLIINNRKNKDSIKIHYSHQRPLVHTSIEKNCFILQYDQHLEVWSLDQQVLSNPEVKLDPSFPVKSEKLLSLSSDSYIKSCSISPDASFLGFSNQNKTAIYRIKTNFFHSSFSPSLTTVILPLPQSIKNKSSYLIVFSCQNKTAAILSASNILNIIEVVSDYKNVENIKIINRIKLQSNSRIKNMTFNCNGNLLAINCLRNGVKIVSTETMQVLGGPPQRELAVVCICFHPFKPHLLLASYPDSMLIEYNIIKNMYTKKSKKWLENFHLPFTQISKRFISSVAYDNQNPNKLILSHDSSFSVVDWSKLDEAKNVKSLTRLIHTKVLLEAKRLTKGDFLLVERSAASFLHSLAPPFKKNKFGV